MPALAIHPATCASCGHRPAVTETVDGDRLVLTCFVCIQPIAVDEDPPFHMLDLPVSSRAVYYARLHPGRNAKEIADAIGLEPGSPTAGRRSGVREDMDRNASSNGLLRAVKAGYLRRVVDHGNDNDEAINAGDSGAPYRYYPTDKDWSPPYGRGSWRDVSALDPDAPMRASRRGPKRST